MSNYDYLWNYYGNPHDFAILKRFLDVLPSLYAQEHNVPAPKYAANVLIWKDSFDSFKTRVHTCLSQDESLTGVDDWMRFNFSDLVSARKTVYRSCRKNEMRSHVLRQELFDLFEGKNVSEESTCAEINRFLGTLEKYMHKSPILLYHRKYIQPMVDRGEIDYGICYGGADHFNYLWNIGFFDAFDHFHDLKDYMNEAPHLFLPIKPLIWTAYGPHDDPETDTTFMGNIKMRRALMEMLQMRLSLGVQQKLDIQNHAYREVYSREGDTAIPRSAYDPWDLLETIKQVFGALKAQKAVHMFDFYSDKQPEKLAEWTKMVVATNREPGFLKDQNHEYYEALNRHMVFMFPTLKFSEIQDEKTALRFCTVLDKSLKGRK